MRKLVSALALAVGLTAPSPSALAGIFVASGTIDGADPTMPVVSISAPNCTGQGVTPVHYEVYQFTVDASGNYAFGLTRDNGIASMYLFESAFNPNAAFPNCIAGDNTAPVGFDEALTAFTTYFAVAIDDTFSQLGADYTLTIEGPGNINVVGTVPEPGSALLFAAGVAAWLGNRRRQGRALRRESA